MPVSLSKYQPAKNLPTFESQKKGENRFLNIFSKSLVKSLNLEGKHFLLAKELNLNGYGIADLVLLEYAYSKTDKDKIVRKIITSFEIKIKDWRTAVKQAFRYKFFSNRVIVVLPNENIKSARKNLHIFKELEVGIWSFDFVNRKIDKIYTPRKKKELSIAAKRKALLKFSTRFKFLQFS
ncbi:MAG: hypothetical protein PVH88_07455 [Ignavibacteria bacterium]|jgi:hypothetical protein